MKFSILLTNNNRSKAYLQNLIKKGLQPEYAIVLNSREERPENTSSDLSRVQGQVRIRTVPETSISFNDLEHVLDTLENNHITHEVFETLDPNSPQIIDAVSKAPGESMIYSGPGATILKPEILNQSKTFIHVHPGKLPSYRGSTTLYYSLLLERKITCSVISMSEKIDEGPVLHEKSFTLENTKLDYDYVVDPCVRTAALIEYLESPNTQEITGKQDTPEGQSFYVIHPVLKHLAIMGLRDKNFTVS